MEIRVDDRFGEAVAVGDVVSEIVLSLGVRNYGSDESGDAEGDREQSARAKQYADDVIPAEHLSAPAVFLAKLGEQVEGREQHKDWPHHNRDENEEGVALDPRHNVSRDKRAEYVSGDDEIPRHGQCSPGGKDGLVASWGNDVASPVVRRQGSGAEIMQPIRRSRSR
jgi:hypothetical protein